jgi:Lecithin retinol acyltransferase
MDSVKEFFTTSSLLKRWRLQTASKKTIPYDESKLEPGDVVSATPAFGFIPWVYHYGVFVGDKRIVHVQKQGVVDCNVDEFMKNRTKAYIEKLEPLPHEIDDPELLNQRRSLVVKTAESMVGNDWEFRAISENCESFSNWVTTGKMHSQQGAAMRNTALLYGASVAGYFIGRGRVRFWRPSWWRGKF